MAHKVTFRTKRNIHLGGPQDIKFVIKKDDNTRIGILYIGKGGVKWESAKGKCPDVSWEKFKRMMEK